MFWFLNDLGPPNDAILYKQTPFFMTMKRYAADSDAEIYSSSFFFHPHVDISRGSEGPSELGLPSVRCEL